MQNYDFDTVIERRGTGALKYDALERRYGRADLTPLWVADMDFATPPFIVEALKRRMEHPIFGYTVEPENYWPVVAQWIKEHHGWAVDTEWMTFIPGIVKGIAFALHCFTQEGDKVIIQPPVYHPFRLVPENMGREVVYNPLKEVDGRYEMDFEQLESIIDERCKVLILSSPHNPGGMVWPKETLIRLAEICH
ncbi:MAG: aminotransferase class I/II-fold pyridoxal phosphate-dependent enzyme, partial [Bacteroidales bacterium]|nr:aminotransferase class I/II-fold pyridoxal phosphate-dependent enzyme [Bacteroidales bacterium]